MRETALHNDLQFKKYAEADITKPEMAWMF